MERVSGEARNRWHVSLPLNHSLEQKERQIAESSQFRVDQLSNEYFNQKNFLIGVDEWADRKMEDFNFLVITTRDALKICSWIKKWDEART